MTATPPRPGQLSPCQALLGGIAIIMSLVAVVAGLSLLIERGEYHEPDESLAEPEVLPGGSCPQPADAPAPVAAYEPITVTAEQLLECPDAYDQQAVRYRGEAVRAVLRRDGRAWVHLNDDPYGLELGPLPAHRTALGGNSGVPVSIPIDAADDITHIGDARHHGDIIAVTGTFHRVDPADGGGPTIQAGTVSIGQAGQRVSRPVSRPRIITAVLVALLALASTAAVRLRSPLRL